MLTLFVIAVGLSMDAFSLSLVYGTLNLNKKTILLQSIIVGLYHFIMPNIGNLLGEKILGMVPINSNIIVFIVLFIIGIQMILETFKHEEKLMNKKGMLLFGLAVSIDSLSLGVGLKAIYDNTYIAGFIFMIISFLFTYIGLIIGKKVNEIVGKISTIIGGIILIIIGLLYVV